MLDFNNNNQVNMFDYMLEISSYPKKEPIGISKYQLGFIVNALKVYDEQLKNLEIEEIKENALLRFRKNKEVEESKILIEYLESKLNEGSKKNIRIRKSANNLDNIGMDPFDVIGEN